MKNKLQGRFTRNNLYTYLLL